MKDNTPIVVANESWPLPENLVKAVQGERMVSALIELAKPGSLSVEEQVGDVEVVAYLMPATQVAPIGPDATEIYLYCAGRLLRKQGMEVPPEIEVKEISQYQQERLNDLKRHIFKTRGGKERNPIINALTEVFKEEKKKCVLSSSE